MDGITFTLQLGEGYDLNRITNDPDTCNNMRQGRFTVL